MHMSYLGVSMNKQIAVVTGATRGVGKAVAEHLHRENYTRN